MTIRRHRTKRLTAVAAMLSLLTGGRFAVAGPSCAASCVARMASCRAERCRGATGEDRHHCRDVCRTETGCAAGAARTRTIAAIVNECRAAGGKWTTRQRLEIRRGDCPPVIVMPLESSEPALDSYPVCLLYGLIRVGGAALSFGVFQGLAVSPDGETVLFQVTDDFLRPLTFGGAAVQTPPYTLASEGIYVVRADGSGLRRIADQSRDPPFAAKPDLSIAYKESSGFSFSPDGTSVVASDRGPGADGSDAPQVVMIDPRSGVRRQLTNFTASQVGVPPNGLSLDAFFLDEERIGGQVYLVDGKVPGPRYFRMRRNGKDFEYLNFEAPVVVEGATLDTSFRVSGLLSDVFTLRFATTTDQPFPGSVREIFVSDGRQLLQLTNYGRSDTAFPIRLRDRNHVVFTASADPVKRNASNTCQLFNVDRLAGGLRQLTRFDGGLAEPGCGTSLLGCTVTQALDEQDPSTGAIVFDSSCNAFGSTAVGQQVFAIRPDGSGFRQVTNYRGATTDSDGAVSVELPGPVAYQALVQ